MPYEKLKNPFIRYLFLYCFYLILLFILFDIHFPPLSFSINDFQSSSTLSILKMLLPPGQVTGIEIWINDYYRIAIDKSCNGSIAVILLYASILAYSASSLFKIVWMIIGYIILFCANIIRILIVVYAVESKGGEENFYWAHDILGNVFLMVAGLSIFILFIKSKTARYVKISK